MSGLSPFPTIQRKSLYESVKDEILLRIRTEQWSAGSILPNEIELARLFGVSQGTVRRAIHDLSEAGILVRRQGKGTFVNDYGQNRSFTRRQFQRFHPDREGVAWSTRATLRLFEEIPASVRVARALDITPASPVLHVRRDLEILVAREPVQGCGFDELFLPRDVFPTLTEAMLREDIRSLYEFYQSRCDVTVVEVEDRAKAVHLNPEQAARARVPMPWPAIQLERISRNLAGRPVELRIQVAVTEGVHLVFL